MPRKRYRPLVDIPISASNDRLSILLERVRGKTVLDLGCSGTKLGISHFRYQYLHHTLAKEAGEILGVDIDEHAVAAMKAAGFNVQAANAETMNLGRRFQVIIAGDIIEHLPNPGLFLKNMRDHLEEDGELLITTPNPFKFKQILKILKYNQVKVHAEHTCWICPTVLKRLLEISGLKMTHLFWIRDPEWYRPSQWPALIRPYWSPSFLSVAKKGPVPSLPDPLQEVL
jgi:2-polyprenyl-3-methyl-5-hydroxy-6-metoxy-1,4-benzoquinol methylase